MTTADSHAPLIQVADWGDEAQLLAAGDIDTGVLLVGELPSAFVETRPGEDEAGPWLLLEAILASQPTFGRVNALALKMTKWPLTPDDQRTLEHLAGKYKRNNKKLAPLYHRVAANNLRYANAGINGYGIWPTISRANHSCEPNARLAAARHEPLAELLLATRPIAKGAAITWNYYSDESFLALDWFERNARLLWNFQFLCRCTRCQAERPPQLAGMSNTALAAVFVQARRQGSASKIS